MKLAGILGSLALFCSQGTMNGLALVSHLFYSLRTKDLSGTGSNKHKYIEAFGFACGRPIKFCALHMWLTCLLFLLSTLTIIYIISNSHIYSTMPQLFFISFVPWSRCYWSVFQATVSDVQSPEVQGKAWCSAASREHLLHPSCSLLPCSLLLHLMLKACSHHGTWRWDTTHTRQLKSWDVSNSFITYSGWGLPVAPWRWGARERVKRSALLRR